jgi:putative IMPACT (imprinted ancient) family translation regulator
MHLVEILLPLADNDGRPFAQSRFVEVRDELVRRFGGVTAFTRTPAEGIFEAEGTTVRDDIVVLEVMAESLDRTFWNSYRAHLEETFEQDEIVIRASAIERL